MNFTGFAKAMGGHENLRAPGTPQPSEKDQAVTIARVILQAPNIDHSSHTAILARQFLRALGLPEKP